MTWARLLKAALAVLVLGFLIYYVEPEDMRRAAAGADPWWIAAAVLLMPLNLFLEGLVWHRLLRRIAPAAERLRSYGALLAGYSLGFFTPARAGDYAARAFYVDHPDRWEVAAIVAVHKGMAVVVRVVGGACALVLFVVFLEARRETAWVVLTVCGSVVAILLIGLTLRPAWAHFILHRLLPFDVVRRRLAFVQYVDSAEAARLLSIDAARYGVYVTQFVFLVHALSPRPGIGIAYVGVALIFFTKSLLPSITLMDLGIREGAAVFFLGTLGFPEAAALNAALLVFGINLILPAMVGFPLVLRMRLQRSEEIG